MPATLPFLLLTLSLPKPSIFWHQTTDAEGKQQIRCTAQGKYEGSWFYLYQGSSQEPVMEKKALPTQAEVTFAVQGSGPNEQFRCSYQVWEAGKLIQSPLSSPANISVDHYPKPSIAVSPSSEIPAGTDWTIHCWAPLSGVNFVLYQAREFRMEVTPRGDSNIAEFSLKNVSMADAGRYTCYYHSVMEPAIWSNASNPVQLRVRGADEVPNYQEVLVDSAGRYQVNCSARFTQHNSSGEGWFYLYSDGKPVAETRAWHDGRILSFNLTEEALSVTRGELTCQYGGNRLNDTVVLWTEDSRSRNADFTTANRLRLGFGAGILLVALLFIADAFWNEKLLEN